MTMEQRMMVAHKIGCTHADLANDVLHSALKLWFKTEDERTAFLAGYIGELKRLNKEVKWHSGSPSTD